MQETSYYDEGRIKKLKEFFLSQNNKTLFQKMDMRLDELKGQGHTLVRRVKMGRNEQCLCGSGLKFKKCCIHKSR